MRFSCFSICEVEVLPDKLHERYFSAVVKVLGSIIGFVRSDQNVSNPELITDEGGVVGLVCNELRMDDFSFLI